MTIEEIKKLLAAATPGPWSWPVDMNTLESVTTGDNILIDELSVAITADKRFIAAAPEAIALLLAEVERLQEPKICIWNYKLGKTTCRHGITCQHPPYCGDCGGKIVEEK